MIKYSDLKNMFKELDFEVEEYSYETIEPTKIPFGVYAVTGNQELSADGITYIDIPNVRFVYVDEDYNFPKQKQIDKLFRDYGIFFDKEFDNDPDEKAYTITYQFSVINDWI